VSDMNFMEMVERMPVVVLAVVLILIAVRKLGDIKLPKWGVMCGGALVVILTGHISVSDAIKAIDWDVIVFLFGMFVVGAALEESGYLSHIFSVLFNRVKTKEHVLLLILFGFGIVSFILMNDTGAVIGVPLALEMSRVYGIPPKVLLLALCFAVTIGSVASPVGNPQNLIIALNGKIANPFIEFAKYLLLPTIVNIFVAFFVIKFFYGDYLRGEVEGKWQVSIKDERLVRIARTSLWVILLLILLKVGFVVVGVDYEFRLTYIAVGGMLPILLLSKKRVEIIKKVDWSTLLFFIGMFILMDSVWRTGFFQGIIKMWGGELTSLPVIFGVSILISQFISNVPFVALCLPIMMHMGADSKDMVALAAASTIAGNLTIMGAASNIIIIQNAEVRKGKVIKFMEFARIGIPLTIINTLIYIVFLYIIP